MADVSKLLRGLKVAADTVRGLPAVVKPVAKLRRGMTESAVRARFTAEQQQAEADTPGQKIMRLQRAHRKLRKDLARSRLGC